MTAHEPDLDLAAVSTELVERLRNARVHYEVLPHRRTSTAAGEARVLHVAPEETAKTLIAHADGDLVRAVVPATRHLDLEKLAESVGADSASLLTEHELAEAYPGFELGAVPPFGGPEERVVVDDELAAREHVVLEAGVHDTSLRLKVSDLLAIAHAEVAPIARP